MFDKLKKDLKIDSGEEVKDEPKVEKAPEKEFVTMDQLNSFGSSLITTMTNLFKKEMEVRKETISQGQPILSQEFGQDTRGIEAVAPHDLIQEAEMETFMNQVLTIYVHPSANKEDLKIFLLNVNGVNQPLIRGKEAKIKRKYVEVLARNRHTRYDQRWPNPAEKHRYLMVPDTAVSSPFVIRHDPDPRGAQWLSNILQEA